MIASELDAMLSHDESHWWYRGRRRVLRATLDGLELPPAARLLDAGCGSGRTLDELARYGIASGVDLSPGAVRMARRRGSYDVVIGRVDALPFREAEFDLVTCLDVVEHTPDDRLTLGELQRVTRPGGLVVVMVPAYQALWSTHDEVNRHHRRYTASSLRAAARDVGLEVVSDTYFNSLLLAPAAAVRWARRVLPARQPRSDLELTPAALDHVLEKPMAVEARAIARGRRIPAGLSLLAVLRRPEGRLAHDRPAPRCGNTQKLGSLPHGAAPVAAQCSDLVVGGVVAGGYREMVTPKVTEVRRGSPYKR